MDLVQDETLCNDLENLAKEKDMEFYKISSATGNGIKELMKRVSELLKELPKEDLIDIS